MKAYFDTTILVAALVGSHVHHLPAQAALERVVARSITGLISGHGAAETYSVLTRTPFSPGVFPMEAWQFLSDNVFPLFEIVALKPNLYQSAIETCAHSGWSGGRIYDALHLACARQASCDRIYTFNVRHFQQLAPDLADRISFPFA